jgi:hypothetical protein
LDGKFIHKGKDWDYVREGTVGLLEEGKALSARGDEIERALKGGLLSADETRKAKVALDEVRASKQALASVVGELGGTDSPFRVPQKARVLVRHNGVGLGFTESDGL